MKIPRCPVCREYLASTRTVDERRDVVDGAVVWTYRLACPGCLAIVRVGRGEIDGSGRQASTTPVVDLAGAVVARLLERLRAASAAAELVSAVVALGADAGESWLLRVPEVFAAARPAYGDSVRTRCATWFVSADPIAGRAVPPSGLVSLAEVYERDRDECEALVRLERLAARLARPSAALVAGDGTVLVRAGAVLSVVEARENGFLLGGAGLDPSWTSVEGFVATADLLAPAVDSP